jgi:hypothetical protein
VNKEQQSRMQQAVRMTALQIISAFVTKKLVIALLCKTPEELHQVLSATRKQLEDAPEVTDASITFPELAPEWSDHWADELQQTLAEEYKKVLSSLSVIHP